MWFLLKILLPLEKRSDNLWSDQELLCMIVKQIPLVLVTAVLLLSCFDLCISKCHFKDYFSER